MWQWRVLFIAERHSELTACPVQAAFLSSITSCDKKSTEHYDPKQIPVQVDSSVAVYTYI